MCCEPAGWSGAAGWGGQGVGGLAEVRGERGREGEGEGGGVSSGGRGEHCLRRGGDERGCLCQSLIPPFGK